MKRAAAVLCGVVFAACCLEPAAEGGALSLGEAIGLAQKSNKEILAQEKAVAEAAAGAAGARSVFFPRLDAQAGYTHNDFVLAFPGGDAQEKDPGVATGYEEDLKTGLTVRQTLYSGGADTAALRRAKAALEAEREKLRARRLDAEFETRRLYFGLLLAHETERIAAALVAQAQSHYEDVRKRHAQGTASKFDLLQSKVQISKAEPQKIRAQNAVSLIEAELKILLGLDLDAKIAPSDKFEYEPVEIDEREFLRRALEGKPEMAVQRLGIDAGKWGVMEARGSGRPRVEAQAGYSFRSDRTGDLFDDRHSNWNAGVGVSMPLFDGFSSKARVDAARERYAQAGLGLESMKDRVAVEVRRVCLDLKEAAAIVTSQRENIGEAREALRIAEASYNSGEGTNLDVLDAQVSLSQVEKNLSEAVYDYLLARAALDRVTGKSFGRKEGEAR